MLYVWDRRDFLRAYRFNNASQGFDTAASVGLLKPEQTGGPSVSANGDDAASGIDWAVTVSTDANETLTEATLRAFSASNITQELYNSDTNRARDRVGFYTKFAAPVVANGKVYVATHSNEVAVYGLMQPRTLTATASDRGTIVSDPGGIVLPRNVQRNTVRPSTVQLTPLPHTGNVFTGSGNGTCTIVMNGDKAVAGTFARAELLAIGKSGSGTVALNGAACNQTCTTRVAIGANVTLPARPAPGERLLFWSSSPANACGGNATTCTFVFSEGTIVKANFSVPVPPTQGYHFCPYAVPRSGYASQPNRS